MVRRRSCSHSEIGSMSRYINFVVSPVTSRTSISLSAYNVCKNSPAGRLGFMEVFVPVLYGKAHLCFDPVQLNMIAESVKSGLFPSLSLFHHNPGNTLFSSVSFLGPASFA